MEIKTDELRPAMVFLYKNKGMTQAEIAAHHTT